MFMDEDPAELRIPLSNNLIHLKKKAQEAIEELARVAPFDIIVTYTHSR